MQTSSNFFSSRKLSNSPLKKSNSFRIGSPVKLGSHSKLDSPTKPSTLNGLDSPTRSNSNFTGFDSLIKPSTLTGLDSPIRVSSKARADSPTKSNSKLDSPIKLSLQIKFDNPIKPISISSINSPSKKGSPIKLESIGKTSGPSSPTKIGGHSKKPSGARLNSLVKPNTSVKINSSPGDPNEKGWKRNLRKNFEKIKGNMQKTDSGVVYENIQKVSKERSIDDLIFMMNCLMSHFVFHNLSEGDLENIVPKMYSAIVPANEFIFNQGDNASSFFIVESGSFDVIINGQYVRTLKKGDGFGELALLYNAPRSASIKAKELCSVWGIDRPTFRKAIEEHSTQHFAENRKFIEAVSLFQSLTYEQMDAVASVIITQKFNDEDVIIREGDPGSSFYVIKEGVVQVEKENKEIRKLTEGDAFGEQVLYDNTIRQATVKAIGKVKCLALSRENLTQILGIQFKTIMYKNLERWALQRNKLFSNLTKVQVEKTIDAMRIVHYKAGDVFFNKGALGGQRIIVVIEGEIKKKSDEALTTINKGEAFGDDFIYGPNKNKRFDEDYVMKTNGVVAEITIDNFIQCIGGSIELVLKKNETSHEKKMMNRVSSYKSIALNIKLEELVVFKKLGYGQFGSVYLVKHKDIPEFFALKSVLKAQVYDQGLEKYIQQEKAVLEAIRFPFIIELVRTFKDNSHIFFLMEYVKGLELFDVIRDIGLLGTPESQFYIGSMILAIEYLHAQAICYRDLKPENVMVDHKGYMKLIDLGTAKFMDTTPGKRTFTIIGTPHYMAPEVLSGKGYGLPVDLWSIGVCFYEFMCGMVPFGEDAEDPYEIYEQIITKPIKFPKYLKDLKAKTLMTQLLNKLAEARSGGSFAALKANPWFENFDWDGLHDKELEPPYLPPKEKLITDFDISKMERLGKRVTKEIEEEEKASPKKFTKKASQNANWDKDF